MPPISSVEVRRSLLDALRLDLVGPGPEDTSLACEVLPTAPSKWYLTGFLVPRHAPAQQREDDTGDDELDEVHRIAPGDDETTPERGAAKRGYFPSSMGLSLLAAPATDSLGVEVHWGDYEAQKGAQHELKRREDEEGTVAGVPVSFPVEPAPEERDGLSERQPSWRPVRPGPVDRGLNRHPLSPPRTARPAPQRPVPAASAHRAR